MVEPNHEVPLAQDLVKEAQGRKSLNGIWIFFKLSIIRVRLWRTMARVKYKVNLMGEPIDKQHTDSQNEMPLIGCSVQVNHFASSKLIYMII